MVCGSHFWLCCRIFGVLRFELWLYYLFWFHVMFECPQFPQFLFVLTSLIDID